MHGVQTVAFGAECEIASKPGVGTSTLALNVAAALASKMAGRTLLCDFDISCGMIQFMLKLANQNSVVEAGQHAFNLDERMWADLLTPLGNLDVQHAGNMSSALPAEPELFSKFIGFVRRLYGTPGFLSCTWARRNLLLWAGSIFRVVCRDHPQSEQTEGRL